MSTIESYLKLFLDPGTVTELRAFGDRGNYSGTFDYDHLGLMAEAAGELSSVSRGVYFIPQPIALPARNVIQLATTCATDADVLRRRWVLIDVDPDRPGGTNATQSERDAAWRVCRNVHAMLDGLGWESPIVASSGNGWHLCYPVDAPNGEAERLAVKDLLAGLQERCGRGGASVDLKTFNASRIWKLYGTTPSKGVHTEERPHRQSWIKDAPPANDKIRQSNWGALGRTLSAWRKQAESYAAITAKPSPPAPTDALRRAVACLAKTAVSVSGQGGHNAAYHAAMLVVDGFGLDEESAMSVLRDWNSRCLPPWTEQELRHKVRDAGKLATNRGHMLTVERAPSPVTARVETYTGVESVESPEGEEDDATAEDLISQNSSVSWLWEGWIQRGTLTAIAAEPGVGKTRLCADLLRRMTLGLAWPDGAPASVPAGAKVVWVAADSQWAELASIPVAFGFPPSAIVLNGTRSNPYAGTNLDSAEDLAALERRIRRVKPVAVFVDTAGNATDRETTRPEQAKAFFKPLAEMATRTGCCIILVTHLNKGGEALGRRIVGACRQVIKLECPDPQGEPNRRKLYVDKSNSMKPTPLGITMGTAGNDYDTTPPQSASTEPGRSPYGAGGGAGRPSHTNEDATWLAQILVDGLEHRVKDVIDAGELAGISLDRCYRAMRSMGGRVVESQAGTRKFWKLL